MAHGLSGRPKSERHKRRISEGVKAAARRHKYALWAAKHQLEMVLAQRDYPSAQALEDALVAVIAKATKAASSGADFTKAQLEARDQFEASLWDEIYELRGKLHAAGQNVKAMDGFTLRDLGRKGLVSQDVVDEEMRRRVKSGIFENRPPSSGVISADVALSGYLPCGEPGCGRSVDVAEGRFCKEHKKAEPRSYLSPSTFTPVNLDALLAEAEARLAKAKAETDQAEAQVGSIKTKIEAWDRANPRD